MNGRSNTYRAMLWLALCGAVPLAALAQAPVWSDEDAPVVQAGSGAVTRPEVEGELSAPSVAGSTSEPAVRVRVYPRSLPRSLTPPDASVPRARYIAHLVDQGRVTPPSPGDAVRAPRAPAPQSVYTFVGTSADRTVTFGVL